MLLKINECSVGVLQNSDCHKHAYSNQKTSLVSVSNLNDEEHQLLHIRIAKELQLQTTSLETVCMLHKYYYIQGYIALQKTCCGVFKLHKKYLSAIGESPVKLHSAQHASIE